VTVAFLLCGLGADTGLAQGTLFFDNGGAESGVTPSGTREFSFMGSNWQGGVVATERTPPLYASGAFSYEVESGGAAVDFDAPVESATFFFVHGFGFSQGTATAFDDQSRPVSSADSREASSFGNAANFVTLGNGAPIARIEFSGGVIDNFTFVPLVDAATPTATVAPTAIDTATPAATSTPAASSTPVPTEAPLACVGDCDGDGQLSVSELVRGVNIALGNLAVDVCPAFDPDDDGAVMISELVAAVNAALRGCDPSL